jgi:hypothetical protein
MGVGHSRDGALHRARNQEEHEETLKLRRAVSKSNQAETPLYLQPPVQRITSETLPEKVAVPPSVMVS